MNDFIERYTELKNEGLRDDEIAKRLYVAPVTLKRWKKKHGIKGLKAPQPNQQGITQEQLKQAEANGISRELALQRVRAYGWSVEEAITKPKVPLNERRNYEKI